MNKQLSKRRNLDLIIDKAIRQRRKFRHYQNEELSDKKRNLRSDHGQAAISRRENLNLIIDKAIRQRMKLKRGINKELPDKARN